MDQSQVNLTDDELQAAAQAHLFDDPAVLAKLDSDSRRRLSKFQTALQAPLPGGSDRTRADTGTIGINHDWILQRVADLASRLPASVRGPAAAYATANIDPVASIVEMLAAPESIATAGAGLVAGRAYAPPPSARVETPIRSGLRSVGAEIQSAPGAGMTAKIAGRLLQTIPERTTFNDLPLAQQMEHLPTTGPIPETARMGGPPAREPVPAATPAGAAPRIAGKAPTLEEALTQALDEIRGQGSQPQTVSAPPAQTMTPAGKPAVTAAQQEAAATNLQPTAPPSVPTKNAASPQKPVTPVRRPAASEWEGVRLTPDEAAVRDEFVARGMPVQQVVREILARRLQQSGAFARMPNDAQVAAKIENWRTTGKW